MQSPQIPTACAPLLLTFLLAFTASKMAAEPPMEITAEIVRCYQSTNRIVLTSETKVLRLQPTSEQEKTQRQKQVDIAAGRIDIQEHRVTGSTGWERSGTTVTKIIVAGH